MKCAPTHRPGSSPASPFLFPGLEEARGYVVIPWFRHARAKLGVHRVVGSSLNARLGRKMIGRSDVCERDSERARARVRSDNPSELAPVDKGNAGDFHESSKKAGGDIFIVRFRNDEPKGGALLGARLHQFDKPGEQSLGRTDLFEGMDLPVGEPQEWLDFHERSQEALGSAYAASALEVFEGIDGEICLHFVDEVPTEFHDLLKGCP